ncbi:MAG: hypothetical protein KC492_05420, partial [Myxococcales bacterium]|nr:hypothetical protein [Myxococcales bacterium]
FYRRAHHDISCALNQLLIEERYDAPGQIFDDRGTHAMRLLDAEAQAGHITYSRVNTSAAGLVRRPSEMPGDSFNYDLWKPESALVFKRPPLYFSKHRAEERELIFVPPPLLFLAFEGDFDKLIYTMTKLEEQACQRLDAARTRPVVGRKSILRIHPWDEARTLRESGGQTVPTYKLGARDLTGRQARIRAALEIRGFRLTNRECYRKFRDGDRDTEFPYSSYGAREYLGATIESEPHHGAILTAPGPTFEDALRQLTQPTSSEAPRAADDAERYLITENVLAAFTEEADDVVEENDTRFDSQPLPSTQREPQHGSVPNIATDAAPNTQGDADTTRAAKPREPQPAIVKHRFQKLQLRDGAKPRRIVVLRDARRGRPKGKGNADPPA